MCLLPSAVTNQQTFDPTSCCCPLTGAESSIVHGAEPSMPSKAPPPPEDLTPPFFPFSVDLAHGEESSKDAISSNLDDDASTAPAAAGGGGEATLPNDPTAAALERAQGAEANIEAPEWSASATSWSQGVLRRPTPSGDGWAAPAAREVRGVLPPPAEDATAVAVTAVSNVAARKKAMVAEDEILTA